MCVICVHSLCVDALLVGLWKCVPPNSNYNLPSADKIQLLVNTEQCAVFRTMRNVLGPHADSLATLAEHSEVTMIMRVKNEISVLG